MAGQIPHSEALKGEIVTVKTKFGGTGIGYLVDGVVYVTTGSYWAIDARKNVRPMEHFERDGGAGYRKALTS